MYIQHYIIRYKFEYSIKMSSIAHSLRAQLLNGNLKKKNNNNNASVEFEPSNESHSVSSLEC